MARKKLTVRRKAHWRKGHIRTTPSGERVRVKRTYVPGGTYKTEDRGAPGRTPKGERWFKPKGHLYGWSKDLSDGERHKILQRAVKSEGYATVVRKLNALKNVSTDRETDRVTTADMAYLKHTYRPGT